MLDGLEAETHYPSPQVFKNHGAKTPNTNFNPYKNDVYGLGATVLMAAKLDKVNDAYNYDKKIIKQEVIDKDLESLRGTYSEGFILDLKTLLTQDEAKRPDFIELDDGIKGYRSDIRAKAVIFNSIIED